MLNGEPVKGRDRERLPGVSHHGSGPVPRRRQCLLHEFSLKSQLRVITPSS